MSVMTDTAVWLQVYSVTVDNRLLCAVIERRSVMDTDTLAFHSLAVTIRTNSFEVPKFYILSAVFIWFAWISEQTAYFALYSIQ
jgi:hypothetical protein